MVIGNLMPVGALPAAMILMVGAVLLWPWPPTRDPAVGSTRMATQQRAAAAVWPSRRPGVPPPLLATDVASTLCLLALALRSGSSMTGAINVVAQHSRDAVAADLKQVVAALAWGMAPDRAFAACGPAWSRAAACLAIADEEGVPAGRLLVESAHALLAETASRQAEAAARLGVRLVVPLGMAFLPAFCLMTVVPIVVLLTQGLVGGE